MEEWLSLVAHFRLIGLRRRLSVEEVREAAMALFRKQHSEMLQRTQ